ncbi:Tn3 family transposase [Streptomyces echinatus]|uniref:Tn3 family transposase n=1 Tax=Streptomyces echinatus TaxID=67293 RepID=UPI00379067AC
MGGRADRAAVLPTLPHARRRTAPHHWQNLMRVVLSIREGRLSWAALLRRLGNESKRNRIYQAYRELGRVMRTIVLLRYLSAPQLRVVSRP